MSILTITATDPICRNLDLLVGYCLEKQRNNSNAADRSFIHRDMMGKNRMPKYWLPWLSALRKHRSRFVPMIVRRRCSSGCSRNFASRSPWRSAAFQEQSDESSMDFYCRPDPRSRRQQNRTAQYLANNQEPCAVLCRFRSFTTRTRLMRCLNCSARSASPPRVGLSFSAGRNETGPPRGIDETLRPRRSMRAFRDRPRISRLDIVIR